MCWVDNFDKMGIFEYNARTKNGEIRSGIIETSSREAALDALHRSDLVVIGLRERRKASLLELAVGRGIKQKDVVVLSRQLATLFEAQIPVVHTLKTLAAETESPGMKAILQELLDDIMGGVALSQAMAKHPHAFSPFYVHLIRSGEESGKLQEIFTYLADYTERSYYLTSKARNAMIYPAFILFAFTAVLIVMVTVVIPRLTSIFEESGMEIPFYTKMIIGLSVFLRQWGLGLLAGVVVGGILLFRWSRTEKGKAFLGAFLLKIPIFGPLYQKLYVARMTDNLRTLIIGGIPIIRALTITADVVGNAVFRRSLEKAIESVRGGGAISVAFEQNPAIPPLVSQMIKIGEVSGRLDFILGSIARFYQKEVDSLVENLVALVEPVMIVLLGIGVGILVASVLVPMYNLVGSL